MYKYISIIFRTISVILGLLAGTIIGLDIIPIEPISQLPLNFVIYDIIGVITVILLIIQIVAAFFIQNTKFDAILSITSIIMIMILWILNPETKFPYVCGVISSISLILGNIRNNVYNLQN
ncbi:hypothetical protein MOO46_06640 [Apilactobacillus apisilvae]|uniref:Uncharacterized protein n=1 Tax=Apilactobacillus apisilvae TaxID=2923364 RepID=A0ABY4PHG9_9LACO|nr:hypothetical protein [Apilactobacillus apisilvae]UQS84916.1 hypothetical protein MOO46_06640 [Apilactobacillus apisilvae]